MVKVMCCQVVLGRVLKLFLIQMSVAFLPHEGQNLDLQLCGTLMFFEQVGQTK